MSCGSGGVSTDAEIDAAGVLQTLEKEVWNVFVKIASSGIYCRLKGPLGWGVCLTGASISYSLIKSRLFANHSSIPMTSCLTWYAANPGG